MKKLLSTVLALVLCVSMLAGCTGGGNSADGTDGYIKLGVSTDITSLDPQNHNDTTSAYMTRHIYSNLVRLDENNNFVGDLAKSWNQVDELTVEFELHEGVKFHNGETLTSEDVKFTLERLKTSAKVSHLVTMIESVEVVDDTHFIIHMNTPSNALVSSLYHCGAGILCKSYVEKIESEGKSIAEYPNGTGPFKYVEYITSTSCTLAKFDEYFDEARKAQSNGLIMKVYLEDSARTIALETGEIDLCLNVPTTDAQRIRDNAELTLNEVTSTRIEYMGLTCTKAPFDNKLLRQAMNYAINKEAVVVAATESEGVVYDNYIGAAAIGWYDTNVKYDYNPEKAKELLKEAGYEEGELEFTCYLASDTRAKSATVVQANLKDIGVTMNIEQMDSATFYERCGNGEPSAFFAGWVANAEPDNTYRALWTDDGGNNYTHYSNEKVNELVNIAATSLDKAAVEKAYQDVLATISDDAIWVPLYSLDYQLAYQADLQGVHNSPIGMHDFYAIHY